MKLREAVAPAYLFLCLLLGGASAAGYVANAVLQLIAIPIILWSLITTPPSPVGRGGTFLIWIAALGLLVGILQLVPIPIDLWQQLPGRSGIAQVMHDMGVAPAWLPISLAPHRTIASLLWLLPALAILLATVRAQAFSSRAVAWAVVLAACLSVPLAAIQVTAGESRTGYFYAITNFGSGTGFFANSNHLATLLVASIPFLGALHLRSSGQNGRRNAAMSLLLVSALLSIFVGIAVNGSLAGLGLLVPVLAATALFVFGRRRALPRWWPLPVALIALAAMALVFSNPLENNLTTEQARASDESRFTSFSRSLQAAGTYLPFGSGVGTFGIVYPMQENPAEVTRVYMNHVHGDYIELALETGLAGIILILIFLIWWVRRAIAVWTPGSGHLFGRAATIASGAMLAHSLVDYPLRTAALSALFAICCGLMVERRLSRRDEADGRPRARHLVAD